MTHYKRPWWIVALTSLVIVIGASALAFVVCWLTMPNFIADLDYYGLAWDDRGMRALAALWVGIFAVAVWWLRSPRVASGKGFPMASHSTRPDASAAAPAPGHSHPV